LAFRHPERGRPGDPRNRDTRHAALNGARGAHVRRAPGLFALYVAGYSLARVGEELLRVDPARHILGFRLNFFVAVILTVAGLVWFAWIQRTGVGRAIAASARRGGALLAAGGLLWMAGCGASSHAARAHETSVTHAQIMRAADTSPSRMVHGSRSRAVGEQQLSG
jgi:hypothetical protein